jgi:DNA-binding NarL/FixJ family response regulator
MLAHGSVEDVAQALAIAQATVTLHLCSILDKLHDRDDDDDDGMQGAAVPRRPSPGRFSAAACALLPSESDESGPASSA